MRALDTEKTSRQWVPTSHLMAQAHCDGNLRIWIPKRALPTSHVTSTKHEAIKVLDKGKQHHPRTRSCPHAIAQSELSNPHMSKAIFMQIFGKVKPTLIHYLSHIFT